MDSTIKDKLLGFYQKHKPFIKSIFSGNTYYSIIFYIVLFYLLFVFVALPAVYAFSPISYISAVVSSSMDHSSSTIQLTYNDWLVQNGFNSSVTNAWPFSNGISLGSLVIVYKVNANQIKIGDVIVYNANYQGTTEQIIHRVINETEINGTYYYTTKGDANPVSLPFEINVPYSSVIGEAGYSIPYLGYPKYILYTIGNSI
jgi:signal peptidase I